MISRKVVGILANVVGMVWLFQPALAEEIPASLPPVAEQTSSASGATPLEAPVDPSSFSPAAQPTSLAGSAPFVTAADPPPQTDQTISVPGAFTPSDPPSTDEVSAPHDAEQAFEPPASEPDSPVAELIMVDSRACIFCRNFKRDFGDEHVTVLEGRALPLRIVSRMKKWPADLAAVTPAYATPTFILVHNGREIGRFAGYRDRKLFWSMAETLVRELPQSALLQAGGLR